MTIVRQDGATVTGSPATTYSYDKDGNITKIVYPNNTETDYDYSQMWNASDGQIITTNKRGSTILSTFDDHYNVQRQKIESDQTVLNVEGTGAPTSTDTLFTWHYDNDGHLTDETSNGAVMADNFHDHYQYDPAGNRKEEDIEPDYDNSSPYNFGNYTLENFYTYNADGQLKTETDGSATSVSYNYDLNGSLIETDSTNNSTSVTTVTTNGYDARNRLTSTTIVGVTTTYAYNDNGDRVSQTTGSLVTDYVVDDTNPTGYSQIVETWTGGGAPAITYEEGLTILSQTVSGTGVGSGTQYLMPDGHGSTRQLTSYTSSSSNGSLVARYDYDGFGGSITLSGVPINIASTMILYVGQMWDPGPQTYDDRVREYDPRIGRYNSFDGINIAPGDIANSNKYLYANGNPINITDPSGHFGVGDVLTSIGIGGLLVGLGTPVLTGALVHRAGGSFFAGFAEGTPAGIALAAIAAQSGGVLTPKFASEAFLVAYGTLWGVAIDYLVTSLGKNAHTPTDAEVSESIIQNLRNVSLGRAFAGALNGKFNPEHGWVAPSVSAGTNLLIKSPALLTDVEHNVSNWWSNKPTDWSKSEQIIVGSALAGIQTYITSSDISGIFPTGTPVLATETFKQIAFNGYKQIIKLLFS